MIYSIYKITFPNTKIYIGITSRDPLERIIEHKYHWSKSTLPIHRAFNKYKDQEEWEVIYQTKYIDDIKEKETYFINLFTSHISQNGYNLTLGGEGITGYKFSEEQKQQNSNNKKEFLKAHPDVLQNQINALQKFRDENPHYNKEKAIKQFESEEYRQWFGQRMKDSYKKNGFKGGKKQFPIKLIKDNQELIFSSVAEAAKFLNCTKSAVSNVIHGRSKSTFGYKVEKVIN